MPWVLLVDGEPRDDVQESIRRQAFDVERVRSYKALEERSPTPRPDLVVVAGPLDEWRIRAVLSAYDRLGVGVYVPPRPPGRPVGFNETQWAVLRAICSVDAPMKEVAALAHVHPATAWRATRELARRLGTRHSRAAIVSMAYAIGLMTGADSEEEDDGEDDC